MAQDDDNNTGTNNEIKNAITIFGKLDAPQTGPSAEPLTIDLSAIEATIEPPKAEAVGPDVAAAAAAAAVAPEQGALRWDKYFPLAASLVAALLIGAVAGGAATYEVSRDAPPAAAALSDETRRLQERVAQLSGELAAFKSGVEAANRAASQQLAKIGERLERAEKAQSEPATKLAKIAESLDRLERRAAPLPAPDVTGAVTSIEKQQSKPPAVEGWKLRDYYAGRAVLENRNGTLFEVGPGSMLPGVGKVETVKRVDGKVVVTTPKGVITSSLEPPRRPPYYRPRDY